MAPAWLQVLQKIARFPLESILKRDGRARIGLEDNNKLWSFLKFVESQGSPGKIIQSSDYSAATDEIALDVLDHIWGPFLARLPIDHPIRVISPALWGHRKILLDISGIEKQVIQTCGSLMGEAFSFASLTLLNLCVEELTHSFFCRNLTVEQGFAHSYQPVSLRKDPCAITGDDVVAIRQDYQKCVVFRQIAEKCSFVISRGKDGDSSSAGIFCEDHFFSWSMVKSIILIQSRLDCSLCKVRRVWTSVHLLLADLPQSIIKLIGFHLRHGKLVFANYFPQ
jgi:hypothetical protein